MQLDTLVPTLEALRAHMRLLLEVTTLIPGILEPGFRPKSTVRESCRSTYTSAASHRQESVSPSQLAAGLADS